MFKVKRLSLYELNSMVRDVISMSLPDSYWVEAELSEAREGYGGHCYLELIEKDERSNTPIAKAHASCWRNRWMFIKPNFERITGQRIHAGMKVLLKVHAQFHENYGFSWIVDDIDPNYTMGDMARKRLEISPAADFILEDVRTKVDSVEGVKSANVNLVFEPAWDQSMMSEEARVELGFE